MDEFKPLPEGEPQPSAEKPARFNTLDEVIVNGQSFFIPRGTPDTKIKKFFSGVDLNDPNLDLSTVGAGANQGTLDVGSSEVPGVARDTSALEFYAAKLTEQLTGAPEAVKDVAQLGAEIAPVTGEAIAADELVSGLQENDTWKALLGAIGVIPGVGGILRRVGGAGHDLVQKLGKIEWQDVIEGTAKPLFKEKDLMDLEDADLQRLDKLFDNDILHPNTVKEEIEAVGGDVNQALFHLEAMEETARDLRASWKAVDEGTKVEIKDEFGRVTGFRDATPAEKLAFDPQAKVPTNKLKALRRLDEERARLDEISDAEWEKGPDLVFPDDIDDLDPMGLNDIPDNVRPVHNVGDVFLDEKGLRKEQGPDGSSFLKPTVLYKHTGHFGDQQKIYTDFVRVDDAMLDTLTPDQAWEIVRRNKSAAIDEELGVLSSGDGIHAQQHTALSGYRKEIRVNEPYKHTEGPHVGFFDPESGVFYNRVQAAAVTKKAVGFEMGMIFPEEFDGAAQLETLTAKKVMEVIEDEMRLIRDPEWNAELRRLADMSSNEISKLGQGDITYIPERMKGLGFSKLTKIDVDDLKKLLDGLEESRAR